MRAKGSPEFSHYAAWDVLGPAFDLDGGADVGYAADLQVSFDVDSAVAAVAGYFDVLEAEGDEEFADKVLEGLGFEVAEQRPKMGLTVTTGSATCGST